MAFTDLALVTKESSSRQYGTHRVFLFPGPRLPGIAFSFEKCFIWDQVSGRGGHGGGRVSGRTSSSSSGRSSARTSVGRSSSSSSGRSSYSSSGSSSYGSGSRYSSSYRSGSSYRPSSGSSSYSSRSRLALLGMQGYDSAGYHPKNPFSRTPPSSKSSSV